MVVCVSCSRTIKKKIVLCRNCKNPVCEYCAKKGYCKDCYPLNREESLLDEYFGEKYAKQKISEFQES